MLDDFLRQIYINIWPVIVSWSMFFYIDNRAYCLFSEPREIIVGNKKLAIIGEKP